MSPQTEPSDFVGESQGAHYLNPNPACVVPDIFALVIVPIRAAAPAELDSLLPGPVGEFDFEDDGYPAVLLPGRRFHQ